MDPTGPDGAAGPGLLLHDPGAGTRPGEPALDDRRALVARRIFPIPTVKDVPGHFVNHVVGLDTKPGLEWATYTALRRPCLRHRANQFLHPHITGFHSMFHASRQHTRAR